MPPLLPIVSPPGSGILTVFGCTTGGMVVVVVVGFGFVVDVDASVTGAAGLIGVPDALFDDESSLFVNAYAATPPPATTSATTTATIAPRRLPPRFWSRRAARDSSKGVGAISTNRGCYWTNHAN